MPEQRLFVFDSLLAKPTQKIPKYLKDIKPALHSHNTDDELQPFSLDVLEKT